MSCCGVNCGCGFGCNCGSGCGGCKVDPDLIEEKSATSETFVMGVVSPQKGRLEQLDEMAAGSENGGCKCGSNCTCDPCNCK